MLAELADGHGILLRPGLIAHGYDDNAIRRLRVAGEIVRLRQGAYVVSDVWDAAGPAEQHRLLSSAVIQQYGDDVALSHTSACLVQGGPDWGLDLSDAHITNLHGIGERNAARVRHHRGACRVGDITRSNGHWITSPPRTALDTASISERDPAVCVLDWFVCQGLATREEYNIVFASMKDWPDTLSLHRKLELSGGRSESVGETRTSLLCRDQRLPAPVQQFEIFYPSGLLAGRVDFAWPDHKLMLEFDGRTKYLHHRRPGESIQDAVLREKAREDLLRELSGWMMIRLIWADLDHPVHTAHRIRQAMARAAAV